jgi:hypothetical protein
MAERKQTPDILSAILTADPAAVEAPATPAKASRPAAKKPATTKEKAATQSKPVTKSQPAAQAKKQAGWEYLCISFQQYHGWRARFINGQEILNWTGGIELLEHLRQLGAEGWELCAASAGEPMYGASDVRQLFFKRPLP